MSTGFFLEGYTNVLEVIIIDKSMNVLKIIELHNFMCELPGM